MQVLALVGSPREAGNCDLLVDQVLRGCREQAGAAVEKVMVGDLNILPCQGCLDCRAIGRCDQEDGLPQLVEKIERADALVVAAPIYGNHLPGQFKILFDRLVGVMHKIDSSVPGKLTTSSRLAKKERRLVLIAVAGSPREESCDQALSFLKRVFTPETNGGKVTEIRAIGLSAKGQVAMQADQLAGLVGRLKVAHAGEYVQRMLERNRSYMENAYKIGLELAGEN